MAGRPVWAVVPVKPFAQAKQRLAGILTVAERAWLARVMLQDVLSSLQLASHLLTGTIVVTADAAAAEIGAQHGALVIDEGVPQGLNGAVQMTVDYLRIWPNASMVVVPSDLPHLSTQTMADLVGGLRDVPRVVIVPADHDEGTNLLGCSPAAVIAPHFGPRSFHRHCDAARRIGAALTIINDDLAGHDLDRPADLSQFQSLGIETGTLTLLASLDLGSRHVSS